MPACTERCAGQSTVAGDPSAIGNRLSAIPQGQALPSDASGRSHASDRSDKDKLEAKATANPKLEKAATEELLNALVSDLAPLRKRGEALLTIEDPDLLRQRLEAWQADADKLKADLAKNSATQAALEKIIASSLANGLAERRPQSAKDARRPSGALRAGDKPGHEFHGNQYTDGQGAAERAADERERRQSEAEARELRETKVPMHDQVFFLIGIQPGNVYADYGALQNKHPEQFKSPEEVRTHVEKVMREPDIILPGAEPDHRLIVHQDSPNDKAAALEIQKRGGKYRVKSAYRLDPGQLETKIKKAGGEGAGSPVLRVHRPEAKHPQGAGVPSDTLPTSQPKKP